MYIVAIGWLYVTVLMACTETSILAGVLTFLFYGLFPMALVLWLFGTPLRRRRQRAAAATDASSEPPPIGEAEAPADQKDLARFERPPQG